MVKQNKTAHLVVDMLYDFIDGSMACHNSQNAVNKSIEFINNNPGQPVFYITDSHPASHCSFKENGGIWPAHCVKGTKGQEIHEKYYKSVIEVAQRPRQNNTLKKGEDPTFEQYSGFEAVLPTGQTLESILRENSNGEIYISGIATEYCINATATDLKNAGFKVTLIKDALAYVDYNGHLKALEGLKKSGINVV
ncbi:MAG: isochorismatase family protein [Bacteroidales bacterium]